MDRLKNNGIPHFFELNQSEENLLPLLSDLAKGLPDDILEEFITFIKKLGKLKDKEVFPRLKNSLRSFLADFFLSPFSKESFEKILKVGTTHAEKDVEIALFLKAFLKFKRLFRDYIKKQVKDKQTYENLIQLTDDLLSYHVIIMTQAYYEYMSERLRKAYNDVKELNRIYSILREINLLLFEETNNLKEFFNRICEILVKKGGFDLAWIGVVDSKTSKIKKVSIFTKDESVKDQIDNLVDIRNLWENVIQTGKVKIIQNIQENAYFESQKDTIRRYNLNSAVIFPMMMEDEVKGILAIYHSKVRYFTSEEIKLPSEILRDISIGWRHIKRKNDLENLLFTDELTGLRNERFFMEILKREIEEVKKQKRKIALILLDLENFTLINQGFGRAAGDRILKEVGRRLVSLMKDQSAVARIGADSFACFYVFDQDCELRAFLNEIKEIISLPIILDEKNIRISVNIGIAISKDHIFSSEELFENASSALQKAKKEHPWGIAFYSEEIAQDFLGRWHMAEELKQAYDKREFTLFFQPKINLISRKITGFEALLRWNHPEKGLILPGNFISVLEESGLIIQVGRWVIKECARFLKKILSIYPKLSVSFNLSVRQLQDNGLAEFLRKTVDEFNIPTEKLEIEITESALLKAPKIIEKIHKMGFKFAIDDFGTGYSSFAYLKRIPAAVVKIDYSFIRALPENRDDASVVMAIVSMARNLGRKTVAEGVERKDQLAFLMGLGVDEVQGYYFSPPVPEDETLNLLKNEDLLFF